MFTGLVQAVGVIESVDQTADGREFALVSSFSDLGIGESVACDGACLTVLSCNASGRFTVAAVETTVGRTTMGTWLAGRRVNLERAVAIGERLGGHFVLGHVDGVGTIISVHMQGDAMLIDVAVPEEVDELLIPHGSITVDGISLTVNALPGPRLLQLSIIGHTRVETTIGDRKAGDLVHLEADVLGKFVRRLLKR